MKPTAIINFNRRISDSYRHPQDPDHEDFEDLQELFAQQYAEEYAEHGTMGGEDATDLELNTNLENLKQAAIAASVASKSGIDRDAWAAYGAALTDEIRQAAWDQMMDDWQELFNAYRERLEEDAYGI